MSKRYKAGIIGLGNIGFRYTLDPLRKWISSHLQAYNLHEDFEPIAVCDINQDRLKAALDYCPQLKLYSSWRQMLVKEKLDVLSVCVSPEMNYEISSLAAISKLQAIIFEKPLCRDVKTAGKIINNLKRAKVYSTVNFFRRWQGTFIRLKELINSGIIGEIRKVNGRCATGLFNGGTHLIDIIQYLLGDFTQIRALEKAVISNGDDFAYAAYGKIDGKEVYLSSYDKADYNIFEIELWGEKGKLFVDKFGTRIGLQQALASPRFSAQKELGQVQEFKAEGLGSSFTNLLNNLASCLGTDGKTKLLCSLGDALQTIKVAEAIVNSYSQIPEGESNK